MLFFCSQHVLLISHYSVVAVIGTKYFFQLKKTKKKLYKSKYKTK